ncbi:hypothetical protein ACLOJK_011238 [Asimina triloba]
MYKIMYTIYGTPSEHGAPVWCSIVIFPNPATQDRRRSIQLLATAASASPPTSSNTRARRPARPAPHAVQQPDAHAPSAPTAAPRRDSSDPISQRRTNPARRPAASTNASCPPSRRQHRPFCSAIVFHSKFGQPPIFTQIPNPDGLKPIMPPSPLAPADPDPTASVPLHPTASQPPSPSITPKPICFWPRSSPISPPITDPSSSSGQAPSPMPMMTHARRLLHRSQDPSSQRPSSSHAPPHMAATPPPTTAQSIAHGRPTTMNISHMQSTPTSSLHHPKAVSMADNCKGEGGRHTEEERRARRQKGVDGKRGGDPDLGSKREACRRPERRSGAAKELVDPNSEPERLLRAVRRERAKRLNEKSTMGEQQDCSTR